MAQTMYVHMNKWIKNTHKKRETVSFWIIMIMHLFIEKIQNILSFVAFNTQFSANGSTMLGLRICT
jgi:hypothetical protein